MTEFREEANAIPASDIVCSINVRDLKEVRERLEVRRESNPCWTASEYA